MTRQSSVQALTTAFPTPGRDVTALNDRQLFELVYARMRRLAGPDARDLDDLVQVAAEQVLRSLAAFKGESELSTWIYGVCYRVLLGHRRYFRRWTSRFALSADAEIAQASELSPSVLHEQHRRAHALRRTLAKMSEKYRAVVILHDIEELSIAEIATIVRANELTVRSRLRDGRKQLLKLVRMDSELKLSWPDE